MNGVEGEGSFEAVEDEVEGKVEVVGVHEPVHAKE